MTAYRLFRAIRKSFYSGEFFFYPNNAPNDTETAVGVLGSASLKLIVI
jgi:hypothetical protein